MKRYPPTAKTILIISILIKAFGCAFLSPSRVFVFVYGRNNDHNGKESYAATFDPPPSPVEDRNIASLLQWADQNSVVLSSRIHLTTSSIPVDNEIKGEEGKGEEDRVTDYGVTLHPPTSSSSPVEKENNEENIDENSVLLKVPKTLILDSQIILKKHYEQLRPSLEYLETHGFSDARHNFCLVVQLLHEKQQQQQQQQQRITHTRQPLPSPLEGWIRSLPRTYTTGTTMTPFELDCLPPFSRAMADYERERLRVFRGALRVLVLSSQEEKEKDGDDDEKKKKKKKQQNNDGLDVSLVGNDDEITLWAFNAVSTRSWVYNDEEEDGRGSMEEEDINTKNRSGNSNLRSMMVPMGDMFNHGDPPNVEVRDGPEGVNEVWFVLIDDGTDEDEEKVGVGEGVVNADGSANLDIVDSGTNTNQERGKDIYLSYGIPTNPHRFLIRFGFANTQMNEVFSQILYEKPSPELLALGCNDRTKMVYRTMDGAVSNTIWNTVLYSLLEDQVPVDAAVFYKAFVDGDEGVMNEIHDRYVMETSLVLRKHVVKEMGELSEVLQRIEDFESTGRTAGFDGGDEAGNGGGERATNDRTHQQHPRLPMIRRHNEFLYRTLDMVRRRIDARAQAELVKRRKKE